jgi:uncharacterized protein YndB with AHSA1/START domain
MSEKTAANGVSERTTKHGTFVLEHTYDATPARVFAAWADPAAKPRWFGGPDDWENEHTLDFRVGGTEWNRTTPPDGPAWTYTAAIHDIVPDRRIVYSYVMECGDAVASVTLATVEFEPAASGTRLVLTEQIAFLDGLDSPDLREGGTRSLLDSLDEMLQGKR